MSDGELTRLEVLRDLDQKRLTTEAAGQLLSLRLPGTPHDPNASPTAQCPGPTPACDTATPLSHIRQRRRGVSRKSSFEPRHPPAPFISRRPEAPPTSRAPAHRCPPQTGSAA